MTDTRAGLVKSVEDNLTEQPLEQRLDGSEVGNELWIDLGKVVETDERVGEKHNEEQEQEEHQVSGSLKI